MCTPRTTPQAALGQRTNTPASGSPTSPEPQGVERCSRDCRVAAWYASNSALFSTCWSPRKQTGGGVNSPRQPAPRGVHASCFISLLGQDCTAAWESTRSQACSQPTHDGGASPSTPSPAARGNSPARGRAACGRPRSAPGAGRAAGRGAAGMALAGSASKKASPWMPAPQWRTPPRPPTKTKSAVESGAGSSAGAACLGCLLSRGTGCWKRCEVKGGKRVEGRCGSGEMESVCMTERSRLKLRTKRRNRDE